MAGGDDGGGRDGAMNDHEPASHTVAGPGAAAPGDSEAPDVDQPPRVSVVVPVYNGANTLDELYRRLSSTLEEHEPSAEIIIVDDASRDDTWEQVTGFSRTNRSVRGLRLARNVGHAGAVMAGFAVARGKVVVMIDADLETAPEELPKLLAAVDAGADLVSGRRNSSRRWERQLGSWLFNAHARRLGIPLRDVGCGMNAMTAAVAAEFVACGHVGRTLVKPYLYAFSRDVVEVEVDSVRPADSRLRVGDLVTLWFRFDMLQKTLALSSVALWGVFGLVVAVIEAVLAVVGAVDGQRTVLAVASIITALISVLLITLSLVAGLLLKSVADREAPFYRVAESTTAPDRPVVQPRPRERDGTGGIAVELTDS